MSSTILCYWLGRLFEAGIGVTWRNSVEWWLLRRIQVLSVNWPGVSPIFWCISEDWIEQRCFSQPSLQQIFASDTVGFRAADLLGTVLVKKRDGHWSLVLACGKRAKQKTALHQHVIEESYQTHFLTYEMLMRTASTARQDLSNPCALVKS